MKQYIFLVEGSHDLAVIGKVLSCIGYKELKKKDEISENFRELLPKKFPFREEGDLDIFNIIPSFFKNKKESKEIVIIVSRGETNHFEKLDRALDSFERKDTEQLEKVIVFSDGDTLEADEKIKELLRNNFAEREEFENFSRKNIENRKIDLMIKKIDVEFYIFPDNRNAGRLEELIYEGINKYDSQLLEKTKIFVNSIDDKYKTKWDNKNSQKDKTTIGVVGNILSPCNSASVFLKNSKWFSKDSKNEKYIKQLYDYLINI